MTDVNNREIRKNAWALYKANFLKLLPAMALLQLLTYAPGIVIGQAALGGFAELLATQIATLLFAPVTLCGAAAFSLDILRGGAPKTHLMLAHARDFRRNLKIWLAALAYYGPTLLSGVMAALLVIPSGSDLDAGALVTLLLLLVLLLALSIFGLWFSLRMGLFQYAAVKNPEARAGEWLKESWRAMRGNCGRLFRMMISVFWPSAAVILAISLIPVQPGAASSGGAISLPTLSIAIFQCFYFGYPQLALAGFADELLAGERRAEG